MFPSSGGSILVRRHICIRSFFSEANPALRYTSSRSSKMYSSFCSVTLGLKFPAELPLATVDSHLQWWPGVAGPVCRRDPALAHHPLEIVPGPTLAMLMVAGEPQPTIGPLSDVGARPITTGVLGEPWTDDLVLRAKPVGDLA